MCSLNIWLGITGNEISLSKRHYENYVYLHQQQDINQKRSFPKF